MSFLAKSNALRFACTVGLLLTGATPALATISAFLDPVGNLNIVGNDLDDDIALRLLAGDPNVIEVDDQTNGPGADFSFPLGAIQIIHIATHGGDDRVVFDDVNGTVGILKPLDVDGGEGDNTFIGATGELSVDEVLNLVEIVASAEGLINEANVLIDQANNLVIPSAVALIVNGNDTLYTPANGLVDAANANLVGPGNALVDQANGRISAAANALIDQANFDLAPKRDFFIAQAEALHVQVDALLAQTSDGLLGVEAEAFKDRIEGLLVQADVAGNDAEALEQVAACLEEEIENFEAKAEATVDQADLVYVALAEALSDSIEGSLLPSGEALNVQAEALETMGDGLNSDADALDVTAEAFNAQAEDLDTAAAALVAQANAVVAQADALRAQADALLAQSDAIVAAASDIIEGPPGGLPLGGGSACPTISNLNNIIGFCVYVGTGNNDQMTGTCGFNILIGFGGDDEMQGGVGTDVMLGGSGNDNMHGGAGIDVMLGNSGDDCMRGDADIDLMLGNADDDNMEGGDDIDVMFGGTGDDTMHGDDHIDLMFGNPGDDIMFGEPGFTVTFTIGSVTVSIDIGNFMMGLDGDDEMHGDAGMDLMFGNANEDEMHGGDAIDVMFGNGENDEMHGDDGGGITINSTVVPLGNFMFGSDLDDEMHGGQHADFMFGNDGDDEMHGDDGLLDLMFGNDGVDTMFGDDGVDLMFGNPGNDTMNGGNGLLDLMFGNPDNDTMNGDDGVDLMFGNKGDDTLHGNMGAIDLMFGNRGDDDMFGDDGIDLMFGNRGADEMHGGMGIIDLMFGNDEPDLMFGDDGIDFMFGNKCDDEMHGGDGIFDLMFGNRDNDTMNGDDGIDLMFGNRGQDDMHGDNSIDLMFGGDDDDQVNGDDGLDIVFGNKGEDIVRGGLSIDLVFGDSGDDELHGDPGIDLMFGGSGADVLYGEDGNDLMFGNSGPDLLYGGNNGDLICGNSSDDEAFGEDGNDIVLGNSDNDRVHGGNQSDLVSGGKDDDRVFGDDGVDIGLGNGGLDKVFGGDAGDLLAGNDDDDVLFGGGDGSIDLVLGNRDNDFIYGGPGGDLLFGNRGADTLFGEGGNDFIFGNRDDDRLSGDADNDRLFGNRGNDTMDGGDDNDWMFGNRGDDDMLGGNGNDKVFGNKNDDDLFDCAGTNVLIGGPGSDTITTSGCPTYNFGTVACSEIHGTKWDDLNANGFFNSVEPKLAGVTVYLDLNNNGVLNGGEPNTVTQTNNPSTPGDETGQYSFTGLAPGTYVVREIAPSGFFQTYPSGAHTVTLSPGQIATGVDFGNAENCHPLPQGFGCTSATPCPPPDGECLPVCVLFGSGLIQTLDCDCVGADTCHVELDATGPRCVGGCPAGQQCVETLVPNFDFGLPLLELCCKCEEVEPCVPLPDGSACDPTACPDPSKDCLPACASFNDCTGEVKVKDCDCRPPGECHVEITPTGVMPYCTGACPAGYACIEKVEENCEGGVDVCCECKAVTCAPLPDSSGCVPHDCANPDQTCVPTAITVTGVCPDNSPCGPGQPCAVGQCTMTSQVDLCDCTDACHVAFDPLAGPYCVGDCSAAAGTECELFAVGDQYRCDCVPAACEPNLDFSGCEQTTCTDPNEICMPTVYTVSGFCTALGTPCTSDSDCPPPSTGCETTAMVTECDCVNPSECHVEFNVANGPYCASDCPDGDICKLHQLGSTLFCDCEEDECRPNDDLSGCLPKGCDTADEECHPSEITVIGTCFPTNTPCASNADCPVPGHCTYEYLFTECDCSGNEECHLVFDQVVAPHCEGSCGCNDTCKLITEDSNGDGLIDLYSCDCSGQQACCAPGLACQEMPAEQCLALGGTPQGAFTSCQGDCNCSGAAGLSDYANFSTCMTGPVGMAVMGCSCSAIDLDADIDLRDFAALSVLFQQD